MLDMGMLVMWAAQVIGAIALVFVAIAFQQRTRDAMLKQKIISEALFGVHYFLIGAYTGAAVGALIVVRDFIFEEKNKRHWAHHFFWVILFGIMSTIVLLSSWAGYISLLPVIGSMLATYAFWQDKPSKIRIYICAAAALWIPYTLFVGSVPGFIGNVITLIFSHAAIERAHHHRKKK